MKPKRTSLIMLLSIIILVIAVHNTLHSEVHAPNEIVKHKMHVNDTAPSYFTASFLRMSE
ncbi:MAG: hypothetical protein ACTHLE_26535 [Agriterribacter sp.]